MNDSYNQVEREWLDSEGVLAYRVPALSMQIMLNWSEDVLSYMRANTQKPAIALLYDLSIEEISLSYLVLTNRDILHPGVTQSGRLKIDQFLNEHPRLQIFLAVLLSNNVSAKLARQHSISALQFHQQIDGKFFFEEQAALKWLRVNLSDSTIHTRPVLHDTLRKAISGFHDDSSDIFNERDEITIRVNGQIFKLPLSVEKSIIIGRRTEHANHDVDLNLGDLGEASLSVSRQHARLHIHGKRLYIVDLRSRNGTYLGTRMLNPDVPTIVREGDIIRIGDIHIMVDF